MKFHEEGEIAQYLQDRHENTLNARFTYGTRGKPLERTYLAVNTKAGFPLDRCIIRYECGGDKPHYKPSSDSSFEFHTRDTEYRRRELCEEKNKKVMTNRMFFLESETNAPFVSHSSAVNV